jgi:hypothetical protein
MKFHLRISFFGFSDASYQPYFMDTSKCGKTPAGLLTLSQSAKCAQWMRKDKNWKMLEDRREDFETIEEFTGFLLAKCLGKNIYWVDGIKLQ